MGFEKKKFPGRSGLTPDPVETYAYPKLKIF
jgi:hypothetical protein